MNNTEKHKQNKTTSILEELLYINGICPSYSIYVILNQASYYIRISTFDIFADILHHYDTIPLYDKISKFHLLKEMFKSMQDWNR